MLLKENWSWLTGLSFTRPGCKLLDGCCIIMFIFLDWFVVIDLKSEFCILVGLLVGVILEINVP